MREAQVSFPHGKAIRDRYIVEGLLGKGGFGAVYRVRDRRVKSNVFALKEVIDPNGYERDQLTFECELLKRLDHPGLPRVYRVFEDERNSRLYMLMDYVEGPNLERLRRQQPEKRFSLPRVMKMMAPIVEAIKYLHEQHPPIIHRDIKPANIIVPDDGAGAVLVDFGIAKEYDQDSTTTAVRHCSPGYGAPEHYARGTNTRTDIYGLAATFYALLTGSVPIDALYRLTQIGSKYDDPLEPANTLVKTIPVHIADALQRAMAINSRDRFATVEEFWQALTVYPLEEEESVVVPVTLADQRDSEPVWTPPVVFTATVLDETPRVRISRTRRVTPLVYSIAVFVLVMFISVVFFGLHAWSDGGYFGLSGQATSLPGSVNNAAATVAVQLQRTPTAPTATPVPTVAPSATPHPAASYPHLAASYSGTISDKYTNPSTDSSMTLSGIQQKGASVSGYFAVGPGLIGSSNFTGSVTANKKVQFLISGGGWIAPLFFSGTIQSDGTLSGTYCSQLNNKCNASVGGFGTWSVSPAIARVRPRG